MSTRLFKGHFTFQEAWHLHPPKQAMQESLSKHVRGARDIESKIPLHPYILIFPPYMFHADVSHNMLAYMRDTSLQDRQLFISATINTSITGHIDIKNLLHSLCIQLLSMRPSLWDACQPFWGAIEAFTTAAPPEEYLWRCLNALILSSEDSIVCGVASFGRAKRVLEGPLLLRGASGTLSLEIKRGKNEAMQYIRDEYPHRFVHFINANIMTLHETCLYGYPQLTRWLCDNTRVPGLSWVNQQNSGGYTPLHIATE